MLISGVYDLSDGAGVPFMKIAAGHNQQTHTPGDQYYRFSAPFANGRCASTAPVGAQYRLYQMVVAFTGSDKNRIVTRRSFA